MWVKRVWLHLRPVLSASAEQSPYGSAEIAHCALNRGDDWTEAPAVSRSEYAYCIVVAFHSHDIVHRYRVAVEMGRTLASAVYDSRWRAERVDHGVSVDIACKQINSYHCGIERGACVYDSNVEQAVGYARWRR